MTIIGGGRREQRGCWWGFQDSIAPLWWQNTARGRGGGWQVA